MASARWAMDPRLALAALAIGSVIWLMAKLGGLESESIDVEVRLIGVPANVEPIGVEPSRVPILVSYPRDERIRVVPRNFTLNLDLIEEFGDRDPRRWGFDRTEWTTEFSVEPSLADVNVTGLPASARVAEIRRGTRVEVRMRLSTLPFPIRVQRAGELPPQVQLVGEIQPSAESIVLTASIEELRRLNEEAGEILTEPVRLDNRTATFLDRPKLIVPAGFEPADPTAPDWIQVQVTIEEKRVEKTIEDVPVTIVVVDPKLRADINPNSADIQIEGRFSLIDRIGRGSFTFAPQQPLAETPGVPIPAVALIVDFSNDVPPEVRQAVRIVERTLMVEVTFVPNEEG
jgi:hypothetical protein